MAYNAVLAERWAGTYWSSKGGKGGGEYIKQVPYMGLQQHHIHLASLPS